MVKATTHLLSIKLPATEIDPNSVKPGWVALLIVLALGAATVLLWRNMGKQLKKIDFDPDAGARDQAPSDAPPTTDSSADQAGAAVQMPTPPHRPGQAPTTDQAQADAQPEAEAKTEAENGASQPK
ncbi:hypothetical protein EV648_104234 [Kribbella sp. VKM Ac-2568]|nr:hypothetical protein EV648_104234 [Kribbella sp. VKM Ac-2568]